MKSSVWSTNRVTRSIVRSVLSIGNSGHRMVPMCGVQVRSDQEYGEARILKDHAANAFGFHSGSFHYKIRCRGYNYSTNHFQTSLGKRICTPCALFEYCLQHSNIGDFLYSDFRATHNATDWQHILLSDELWFVLGIDGNHVWVWKCPVERYNYTHNVAHCLHSWRNGLGVGCDFSLNRWCSLIVILRTSMGQCYVNDIIRPHVIFLKGPSRSNFPAT